MSNLMPGMLPIHRRCISMQISELVQRTNYIALVRHIERLDKERIIPEALLNKWKARIQFTEKKEQNRLLYQDIQKRGPKAFQLLLDGLLHSGQRSLACLLDPTLREPQAEVEESSQHDQYYSNEGTHYVYLDKSWNNCCYEKDREALELLFANLGYSVSEDGCIGEDAGSLIVVIFCSLANGGVDRENYWMHNRFSDEKLSGKPKVLISIRYEHAIARSRTQTDSGLNVPRLYFEDILKLCIKVDASKIRDGDSSVEVQSLVNVFRQDDNNHLEEKFKLVSKIFKDLNLSPTIKLNSRFNKFQLVKSFPYEPIG